MPIATYETIDEREITSTIFPSELNDFTAAWTKHMSLRNPSFVLLQLLRIVQVGISNFNPIHLKYLQTPVGPIHPKTNTEIYLLIHDTMGIQVIQDTNEYDSQPLNEQSIPFESVPEAPLPGRPVGPIEYRVDRNIPSQNGRAAAFVQLGLQAIKLISQNR